MRAGVITAPQTCEVRVVDTPSPSADQVLVAIEGCGVCGSNLPVWEGRPWFEYPLAPGAPGHESWGVVDAVGDGVVAVAPGGRVALLAEQAFADAAVVAADSVVVLPNVLSETPFPGE